MDNAEIKQMFDAIDNGDGLITIDELFIALRSSYCLLCQKTHFTFLSIVSRIHPSLAKCALNW